MGTQKKNLCVIGTGAAGLCATKNGIDFGFDVIAYEQTMTVGGLWNYTDETDKDKNGIDIHSSMYKNLLTNLPIEVMCFPNEPFREQKESFVSSFEVLNYYKDYFKKYSLQQYIKFEHQVFRVTPILNDRWEVVVKNLKENCYETHIFDAVLICSGHFHKPSIPIYKGQAKFRGKQIHSHVYRSSNIFENEATLIIGGNNSAVDLIIDSSERSTITFWSHHLDTEHNLMQFKGEVVEKPDILELSENGVQFTDGSAVKCTLIVYATGYLYSYPFLTIDCGITAGEYVQPLWMHCLSINYPTLAFIGLPNLICPNQMFQLQVEFCLTFISGRKKIPSKPQMIKELECDIQEMLEKRLPFRKFHFLGRLKNGQQKYYDDLSRIADIENIMPCILKMHKHAHENRLKHFTSYRNFKYIILNENEYEAKHQV